MKLTHGTDLGIRVLMVLGLEEGRRLTVPQLSEMLDVSGNHLVKVCIRLASLGYVRSLRGRGGGVELAVPAEDIKVGDALRRLEEDFALVECMRGEAGNCVLVPACELKGLLEEATEDFFQTLNSKSIADLVSKRRRFRNIVSIGRGLAGSSSAA